MKLLHVRHATSILTYAGLKILIDPVLAEQGTSPAIPLTPCKRSNPLVGLSTPMDTLYDIDLILSTHLHRDHFDEKAKEILDKKLPLLCQTEDEAKLSTSGFTNIIPIKDNLQYQQLHITRVNAQHGTFPFCKAMGPASGYILQSESEPTIYITGDTIYHDEVRSHIEYYKPQVMLLNAGSPKFLHSDRIVMNILDLEETFKAAPNLTFVIVHLDTFNHCIETREDLHEYFNETKLNELGVHQLLIPEDNELLDETSFFIK